MGSEEHELTMHANQDVETAPASVQKKRMLQKFLCFRSLPVSCIMYIIHTLHIILWFYFGYPWLFQMELKLQKNDWGYFCSCLKTFSRDQYAMLITFRRFTGPLNPKVLLDEMKHARSGGEAVGTAAKAVVLCCNSSEFSSFLSQKLLVFSTSLASQALFEAASCLVFCFLAVLRLVYLTFAWAQVWLKFSAF